MSLTAIQWKFIAARLLSQTDKEAAEQVKINPATVANWKAEYPEFAAEYEAAFTDGVHVAKQLVRQNLGKAADRLGEALDAGAIGRPDWKARLRAIELMFKVYGLLDVTSDDDDKQPLVAADL